MYLWILFERGRTSHPVTTVRAQCKLDAEAWAFLKYGRPLDADLDREVYRHELMESL